MGALPIFGISGANLRHGEQAFASLVDGARRTYKTSETNPAGHITRWLYDYRLGVSTRQTDTNTIVTVVEYDLFGRPTNLIRPDDSSSNPTLALTYYDTGVNNTGPFAIRLQQQHSGGLYTLYRFYDGLGRLIESVTNNAQIAAAARDIIVAQQYNGYGQLVKQTMPYGATPWSGAGSPYRVPTFAASNTVVTLYDSAGRPLSVTPPTTNNALFYSYPDDLVTRMVNGNGNSTISRTDVWGRMVETRNYDSSSAQVDPWLRYHYDTADQLFSVEKRNGVGAGSLFATTSMNYDLAGRKLAMSDMDMGAWYYRYDALGNLTSQLDARGCTTTLLYNDGLSRLTNKSYSGACGVATSAVSYGYDAVTSGNKGKGKRTSMSDAAGSTAWFYGDNRGRLTRETKTVTGSGAFVTEWGYDSADQLISLTYPDSEVVNYTYLPQMVVNAVNESSGSTYVQRTEYDAAGRTDLRRLGDDQIRTDYSYQAWDVLGGRLRWIRSGTPNGATVNGTLQYFSYNYDANGNVTVITGTLSPGTQAQTFTYDALDRLLSAATSAVGSGQYSQSYTYDTGNGRMVNGPLGNGYAYSDTSHLHAVTGVGANSFGYDANGNMTTRTVSGNSYTQSYDAENRLVGVTGAATASFVYDGDNNRVKGTVDGVTTVYIGNLYEVQGSTIKKYYYAGNQRVAMRDNGTLYWLLGDHLGGTIYTVNGTTETGEVRYSPWGKDRFTSGTTLTSYKYTGQREEASLGLYDYGARWYDPALGRFIQPDTIVPNPGDVQSFDRYAYVNNNPLRYTDPTGHSCADALTPNQYPAEEYDCLSTNANSRIFYLNGLGGQSNYPRFAGGNEYVYSLYGLSLLAGEQNVVHVPLFTEPYQRGTSQLDMIGEALGIETSQTQLALELIMQHLADRPLGDNERLVLVGSSAGGTVAVELLDDLAEHDIHVNQIILRGSFIHEWNLTNVDQADYIAADPPYSDAYYSKDMNPFDDVSVNEHSMHNFSGHTPQTSQEVRQIVGLIVDLANR